jgi:hypothetical protein
MRKFLITAGIVFSFAACSKGKWDKFISAGEGFRDKMCACKDKACTENVRKEEKEWQAANMKDIKEDDLKSAPKDFMEKMDKIDSAERECRHKFDADMTAPTTPPPTPAPAP